MVCDAIAKEAVRSVERSDTDSSGAVDTARALESYLIILLPGTSMYYLFFAARVFLFCCRWQLALVRACRNICAVQERFCEMIVRAMKTPTDAQPN